MAIDCCDVPQTALVLVDSGVKAPLQSLPGVRCVAEEAVVTVGCRSRNRDEPVIALLVDLADRFPGRGAGKVFQIIGCRGLPWDHTRVWRVYCLMQINRRR